jgi:hypothetical protein
MGQNNSAPTTFNINRIQGIPGPAGPGGPNAIAGAPISGTVAGQAKQLGWNGSVWAPRPSDVRNALDYGADNTANVDSTAILQALLDDTTYGGTIGGSKTIYLPSCITGGYYKISKPLCLSQNYTHLEGDTAFGTVIRSDNIHMPNIVMMNSGYWPHVVTSITGTGNSFVFSATNSLDQYIDLRDISYMSDISSFTAFTCETTFQQDATIAGGDEHYFYSQSGSFTSVANTISCLFYLTPGSSGATSTLNAYLNTATTPRTLTMTDAVTNGVPFYAALSWDGTNVRLFCAAPGAMTSHVTATASGALQMNFSEGCWIGGTYSSTWPELNKAGNKYAGKMDSFRISNFARYTSDFTAPIGKLPEDDAHNLNVGGAGNNTYYLTNFDTYKACWNGFTWASGGQQLCYTANRMQSASIGGLVFCSVENLTSQSALGRAIQCNETINGNFDHLELYGTYGLTFEGDSYYTAVRNINLYSTGPLLTAAGTISPVIGRLPYCVAGYLNASVDGPHENLGLNGSFAFGMKVGAGSYKFVKVVVNGYCLIPVHYTCPRIEDTSAINGISVDDENVPQFPGYNGTTGPFGNWLCNVYLDGAGVTKFKDCDLSCEFSDDLNMIEVNSISNGKLAFDNCTFTPSSKSGATKPIIEFLAVGGGILPNRPAEVNSCLLDGTVPWTSTAQAQYLIVDGAQARQITSGTSSTASQFDQVIGINVGTAYDLTTPPSNQLYAGKTIVVKDQSGAAATNNITITAAAGQTIDGAATAVLNVNRGRIAICFDGVSDWMT